MFKKLLVVCGLTLSACDDTDVRNVLKTRRLEAYTECYTMCSTAPVEVSWDSLGNLMSCRCDYDYVVTSEEEVVVR